MLNVKRLQSTGSEHVKYWFEMNLKHVHISTWSVMTLAWCYVSGCSTSPKIIFNATRLKINSIEDPLKYHGPLTRYVRLRVANAPGYRDRYRVSMTNLPWCILGSLTSGFLWSRWRGKRSHYSRRMRNTQFYISGKRPIGWNIRVPDFQGSCYKNVNIEF